MADEMVVIGSANVGLAQQHAKAEVVVIRYQIDKRRGLLTAWKVGRSVNVGEVVWAARAGEENVAFAGC